MKNAAVSELKASLSKYLARVKRGQEVVVTDRGQPVAKLVPFRAVGRDARERIRLAQEGIIELGSGRLSDEFLKPSPLKDPQGLVLKALIEEREEGR